MFTEFKNSKSLFEIFSVQMRERKMFLDCCSIRPLFQEFRENEKLV